MSNNVDPNASRESLVRGDLDSQLGTDANFNAANNSLVNQDVSLSPMKSNHATEANFMSPTPHSAYKLVGQ